MSQVPKCIFILSIVFILFYTLKYRIENGRRGRVDILCIILLCLIIFPISKIKNYETSFCVEDFEFL